MDIGRFTPSQQGCIRSSAPRLFIEAGAGTGKTATLTAKIAFSLDSCEGRLDSIDRLLAITFTNKAAGELKGRVRSTLRGIGRLEDSLKVDDAWVSTIHGMCSRILREHALEAGIDPKLEPIDEQQVELMRKQALDVALSKARASEEGLGSLESFFSEFELERPLDLGAGDDALSIVSTLAEKISSLACGAGDVYIGREPAKPQDICETVLCAARGLMESLGLSPKQGKAMQNAKDAASAYAQAADSLAHCGEDGGGYESLKTLFSLPSVSKHSSFSDDEKEAIDSFKASLSLACLEYLAALSRPHLLAALRLAQECEREYRKMKAAGGLVDMNDLLTLTWGMLAQGGPASDGLSRRFGMCMIDEFQDTDALQLGIVSSICGLEGGAQLITVGDAQQSIYRFRGADVNLFREYAESLGEADELVRLDVNFRSHPDLLAFVNSVFGSSRVFGKGYLRLSAPCGYLGRDLPEGLARVELHVTTSRKGTPSKPAKHSVQDRIASEAAHIAQRFLEFMDAGFSPGDFAVLLGRMTYADIYADALRQAGMEASISAGSIFWRLPEPAAVSALLRCVANGHDSQALFEFLRSEIVQLGDADFVPLSIDGHGRRRELVDGLSDKASESFSKARTAHALLCRARELLRLGLAPSQAISRLLYECGLVARLAEQGSCGVSRAANYLKSIDEIRSIEEQSGCAISQVAHAFDSLLKACPKARPGTIKSKGSNTVNIMTIHASKGLEFPVVALSEFDSEPKTSESFHVITAAGNTFADLFINGKSYGLDPKAHARPDPEKRGFKPGDLKETGLSLGEYHRRLCEFDHWQEIEERRRLFYVGATRARDALVLCLHPAYTSDCLEPSTIRGDIATALGRDCLLREDASLEYGGAKPGAYTYVDLDQCLGEQDDSLASQDEPALEPCDSPEGEGGFEEGGLAAFEPSELPLAHFVACGADTHEFSYSSIAHLKPDEELIAPNVEIYDVSASGCGKVCAEEVVSEGLEGLVEDDTREKATDFGSAFHRLAQRMVASGRIGCGKVQAVPDEDIEAACREFSLGARALRRMKDAVALWSSSESAAKAATFNTLQAELPFIVRTPQSPFGSYLTGEIDLLCFNDSSRAYVVDYKTGGSQDEQAGWLAAKHRLQAACYAQALFASGFDEAELVFVRVERPDISGQPQTVTYRARRKGASVRDGN